MGKHVIRNVSGDSWKCMWCGSYFAGVQVDKFEGYECSSLLSGQMVLDLEDS